MKRSQTPIRTALRVGLITTAAVLVQGCATNKMGIGPDYQSPAPNTPSEYRYASRKNGHQSASPEQWWKVFNDSGLNRLISQVGNRNHTLKAGLKRIGQSRALITKAGSAAFPQVATAPGFNRVRTSDETIGSGTSSNYKLPLSVDWEIDLFGRIRSSEEAATADAQAIEEDYAALQLSLEAEAAQSYFALGALDREISIVQEGVASRKASLKLAGDRKELGAVSGLDVAQAKSLLATGEADLAGLRRLRAAREASLAVLAGKPVTGFQLASRPLTGSPASVPAGLPSELLRARPDIRRAERTLAAENARVGVATAAFYPSLSLSGNLGVQADDIGRLFNNGARFWGIGADVYLPIFQGGRNKAELARSKARYEEVLEDYQQAVLESLAEVEIALSASKFYATQQAAQQRAVVASREARDIAKSQYEGGTANYLNVLDAERTALDAERQQAVLTGANFINTVGLIRALGGRW
ncbi:efflux transporter outer membrane subunit [Verrucomicrobiaceae bacterium 227]